MDINEFEDSIKLQLSDLELVGRLGFVDGISSIIIKNLKALKVHERPVHCTDLKRETMYVNDKGVWEKQENDNKKLRRLIKHIAFKNAKNLSLYKELHPDYNDYYSKCSDHFLKLQIEAFGGSGNETVDNENKIIKKIVKEMGIDKRL
jgi:Txe/YoeB family toxin of Txe-Axe toxin-antitoxin module